MRKLIIQSFLTGAVLAITLCGITFGLIELGKWLHWTVPFCLVGTFFFGLSIYTYDKEVNDEERREF